MEETCDCGTCHKPVDTGSTCDRCQRPVHRNTEDPLADTECGGWLDDWYDDWPGQQNKFYCKYCLWVDSTAYI